MVRPRSRVETYEDALLKAVQDLQKLDPYKAGFSAGCDVVAAGEANRIAVRFFGEDYVVTHPQVSVRNTAGQEPDVSTRLIILHYLIHAEGTSPADHWISFRELPDGLVYDPAFQRRSSQRLVQEYGTDVKGFVQACEVLGGERLSFGDASYMFRLLPRLRMAVILHYGDEEFPPAVKVLFDAAAGHYLPTEDLAVLGGILASTLIKAGNA